MFSERTFFSFANLPDETRLREFNEWHVLDHRPENLLLPEGDRWARTPECAAATVGADPECAAVRTIIPWQDR